MIYIYILKLEKNKYYVGKTTNPKFRIIDHFNFNASEWTKLYKPIDIIKIIPNCDNYDEDKYTRMYMDKYGIDNVRGGSYTSINIDKDTYKHLERMSNGTNDRCFVCSKLGHFAKNCNINEDSDEDSDEETYVCFRCGREGHYSSSCYAKRHIKGYYLKP